MLISHHIFTVLKSGVNFSLVQCSGLLGQWREEKLCFIISCADPDLFFTMGRGVGGCARELTFVFYVHLL